MKKLALALVLVFTVATAWGQECGITSNPFIREQLQLYISQYVDKNPKYRYVISMDNFTKLIPLAEDNCLVMTLLADAYSQGDVVLSIHRDTHKAIDYFYKLAIRGWRAYDLDLAVFYFETKDIINACVWTYLYSIPPKGGSRIDALLEYCNQLSTKDKNSVKLALRQLQDKKYPRLSEYWEYIWHYLNAN